jgi:enamine deaminase RidA (YjgF/YER057c/UK114 family)
MRRQVRAGSPYEETFGYSRAVRAGDVIHVSGTAPIWPDGHCDPDPAAQADRCFEIIAQALAELGASLDDVVRTRMYITDPSAAEAVGRAHSRAVGHVKPAATMIVVAGLLDQRWLVEIEAEATRGRR